MLACRSQAQQEQQSKARSRMAEFPAAVENAHGSQHQALKSYDSVTYTSFAANGAALYLLVIMFADSRG